MENLTISKLITPDLLTSYVFSQLADLGLAALKNLGLTALKVETSEEEKLYLKDVFFELSSIYPEFDNPEFFLKIFQGECSFQEFSKIEKTFKSIFGSMEGQVVYNKFKQISLEKLTEHSNVMNRIQVSLSIQGLEILEKINRKTNTGQILDGDEFIEVYDHSKYSTPLNTKFQFRENEKKEFLSQIKNSDIILVTGRAGVGKTKFALEACKEYSENNNYIFKGILNRGPDIFNDIRDCFYENERYLILIDDVNRITAALNYIKEYYADKINEKKIKIVATVRDYAKGIILDMIPSKLSSTVIKLEKMESKDIKEIIRTEFNIVNIDFLNKIDKLSEGNPRLAMMISTIAVKKNSLEGINDVSKIYAEYFSSIDKEQRIFNDGNMVLSIAIVVFFRVIDINNKNQMELIEKYFQIPAEELWDNLKKLNNLEIIDLYENQVAKVSDQVLATYLFYKIVFVDKKIGIDFFIKNFFFSYSNKLVDTLNPILNAFDGKFVIDQFKDPVNKLWDSYEKEEEKLFKIMETFYFFKETDILIYLNNKIEKIPEEKVEVSKLDFWDNNNNNGLEEDKIISILSNFSNNYEYVDYAVELLANYVKKVPSKLTKIIDILTKKFGYKYENYRYGYTKERKMINQIWDLSSDGQDEFISKLYIRVASYLLKIEFNFTESDGKTISWGSFPIYPTNELKELRDEIIKNIFLLYKNKKYEKDILFLLRNYSQGIGRDSNTEIIAEESKLLLLLVGNNFDSSSYKQCKVFNKLLDFYDRLSISYDNKYRKNFKNDSYTLEAILLLKDFEIEDEKQSRREILEKYIEGYSIKDWIKLLEESKIIKDVNPREIFTINNNIDTLLNILLETDSKLGYDVLEYILKHGNTDALNITLWVAFKILGKEKLYNLLTKYSFKDKEKWMFNYYCILPKEQIKLSDVNNLIKLYKYSSLESMPYHLEYLNKMLEIEPNILIKVVKILLDRTKKEDINYIRVLEYLFNPHSEFFKKIEHYFKDEVNLLKEMYLLMIDLEMQIDYKSLVLNKILNFDINFITEYIEKIFENPNEVDESKIQNDFRVIWAREDYEIVFNKLINSIFEIQVKTYIWGIGHILKEFFLFDKKEQNFSRGQEIIANYIYENYNNPDKMIYIFKLICYFDSEKRKEFFKILLERNDSFEMFQNLRMEPRHYSWTGSRVPSLEIKKDYYISLLEVVNSIKFLKHRKLIEDKISYLKLEIESEKKKDFIEDF